MSVSKFSMSFLVATWIIFTASDKSIASCILLFAAGVFLLIEAIQEFRINKKKEELGEQYERIDNCRHYCRSICVFGITFKTFTERLEYNYGS